MACLLRPPPPVSPTTPLSAGAESRTGRAAPASAVVRCSRRAVAGGSKGGGADDVHATLRALNSPESRHFPRKALGQHYMVNSAINEKLSSIADVKDGDIVLEIGPGTGSLTSVLINSGATVIAIEKDLHMANLVKERFEGIERLTILQEDFTKCRVSSYVTQRLESRKSDERGVKFAKVVANVPFNISTEIIKQLLPLGEIFSDVVLLLQDEAALRLADSRAGSSDYRAINVFVDFFSDAEYRFKVDRTNFFPRPNVDAAVVAFKLKRPRDYPAVASVKEFFSMVNSAFNGKRKMLRKSLQHLRTPREIEDALSGAGLPVTARPEELTLDDFVRLHNSMAGARQ